MSVLNRLASSMGRRDNRPNQALARELAESGDTGAIAELVANLDNPDRNIQSDCIKVLYEIGYLTPELITPYVNEFLKLLESRNNRLVWGGMSAIAAIAPLVPKDLFDQRHKLTAAIERGSVITVDRGIKALVFVAAGSHDYARELRPYFLKHLAACRPQDVPRDAEVIAPIISSENRDQFHELLRKRLPELTSSQRKRVEKLLKKLS